MSEEPELVLHRGIGKPSRCRSCKQEIVFAYHPNTQKNHPFQRDDQGEWTIRNGTAVHLGPAPAPSHQLELLAPAPTDRVPEERWSSHFAVCPDAPKWRGQK